MSQELPPPPPDRAPPPLGPPPIPGPGADPARYEESSAPVFGRLVPTKNPHALWAYYLGIFSLFPCLGVAMGIAAIILGIVGIKRFNASPAIHGRTHAIVGIIGGVVGIAAHAAIAIAIGSIGGSR